MASRRGGTPHMEEECPVYAGVSPGLAAAWIKERDTAGAGWHHRSVYVRDLMPYLKKPEMLAAYGRLRSAFLVIRYVFLHRGYRAVFFYRLLRKAEEKNLGVLCPLLKVLNRMFNEIQISPGADIDAGLFIPHAQCIVIGYSSRIGRDVTVYQGVTLGQVPGRRKDGRSFPTIGNNVMLGAGAKILGPVTIGDNAMIGANAVVTSDIPENAVAVGMPAKVVGSVRENYTTLLNKERHHVFEQTNSVDRSKPDEF